MVARLDAVNQALDSLLKIGVSLARRFLAIS
jgi:hypothetical protein